MMKVQCGGKGCTYLGSEVEPKVALFLQTVFDKKRNLAREAELDLVGQTTGLAEVGQVLEREGKGDRFGHVNCNLLGGLVYAGVLLEDDRA